jgi:hypothetical protein
MAEKFQALIYLMMKPTQNQTPTFGHNAKPQNDTKFIIKCVLAFIMIVSGLFSMLFFDSVLSGLMRVAAGLLLLPPTLNAIERSLKITFNRVMRYVIIVLLFQVSLIISYVRIVGDSKALTEKNGSKTDSAITSSKAVNLENSNKARTDNPQASLKADGDSISTDSIYKYAESEKASNGQIIGRKEKQNEEFKENYLSKWDGSFSPLVTYAKQNMNDPDSFEHVETVFWNTGDHAIVIMKFRGKNALGAKVVNMIKAKVSWDGELLGIINQGD